MIKPKSGQVLPKHPHSRRKIRFMCDCGTEKEIIWKNYKTNHTKSCGNCLSKTKYNIDLLLDKKFGFLRIDPSSVVGKVNSKSRLNFICDCGNEKEIVLKSVVNGLTTSCGCGLAIKGHKWVKPEFYSKDYWIKQDLPLKLLTTYDELPDKWTKMSSHKFRWMCKCGREFTNKFGKIFSGHASSCGKCDFVHKSFYLGRKFGKLELLDIDLPDEFHKRTCRHFPFKCDCGNINKHEFSKVLNGNTTSCGNCNLLDRDEWIGKKFGHLTVLELPDNIKLYSMYKVKCLCSCGQTCYCNPSELVRKHKRTCGKCFDIAHKWYITHNYSPPKRIPGIKTHHNNQGIYYIDDLHEYFDGSLLIPLESIKNMSVYAKFRCKLCGKVFKTKLAWIRYSRVSSCGCVKGNFSFAASEIGHFIESEGLEAFYGKNEKKFDIYKADIYVPSCDLVIEYNGIRYHSKNPKDDLEKFNYIKDKHNIIVIYEDEWLKRKNCFKRLVLNKLGINKPKFRIRPQKCVIKLLDNKEVKEFYEKYHYQGHANSKYNIGVFYNDRLVACMSIKSPTRQNSGDWEISRMACHWDYRIFGLWSYLLKWVRLNNLISGRIITFSDNRLMTGDVYEKMGMNRDGEINPDYYWVRGRNRYHKSGLRKTKEEKLSGKTERQLREEQGYFRIFDLGKVKWVLDLCPLSI